MSGRNQVIYNRPEEIPTVGSNPTRSFNPLPRKDLCAYTGHSTPDGTVVYCRSVSYRRLDVRIWGVPRQEEEVEAISKEKIIPAH